MPQIQQAVFEDEEHWGMRDFSLQNSLRIMPNNPDMKNKHTVSCPCGVVIDRRSDWHVMIASGVVLCRWCATCNRCKRDCNMISRRLVCIDGLVLCHNCLETFGSFVESSVRMRIEAADNKVGLEDIKTDPEDTTSPAGNENNTDEVDNTSNNSNKESHNADEVTHDMLRECRRQDRNKFLEKADNRRPFRMAYYDRRAEALPDELNPMLKAPTYQAKRGPMEKMACPACSQVATGKAKFVVPGLAKIYHKACLVCQTCKEPLYEGVQLAGHQFEYCTCEPNQIWCTRVACKQQRLAHHDEKSCWLGFLRPGGRERRETDVAGQMQRKAARMQKADQ